LACRLFLLRLDAALSGQPLSYYRSLPGFSRTAADPLSTEHVVPKGKKLQAAAEEAWGPLFKSPAHRQVCAQYIGNLVLVPKSLNEALGQSGFADKLALLLSARPHSIHSTELLLAASAWTIHDMATRHRLMMNTAVALWRLPRAYPMPPRSVPAKPGPAKSKGAARPVTGMRRDTGHEA
jgi:Protein of unknown function (DUF1524)